jgi:hypothetical protein
MVHDDWALLFPLLNESLLFFQWDGVLLFLFAEWGASVVAVDCHPCSVFSSCGSSVCPAVFLLSWFLLFLLLKRVTLFAVVDAALVLLNNLLMFLHTLSFFVPGTHVLSQWHGHEEALSMFLF